MVSDKKFWLFEIFDGSLSAPNIKYCLIMNKFGIIKKRKTFRVHKDVETKMETIRYHDLKDGETIAATSMATWNKMLN